MANITFYLRLCYYDYTYIRLVILLTVINMYLFYDSNFENPFLSDDTQDASWSTAENSPSRYNEPNQGDLLVRGKDSTYYSLGHSEEFIPLWFSKDPGTTPLTTTTMRPRSRKLNIASIFIDEIQLDQQSAPPMRSDYDHSTIVTTTMRPLDRHKLNRNIVRHPMQANTDPGPIPSNVNLVSKPDLQRKAPPMLSNQHHGGAVTTTKRPSLPKINLPPRMVSSNIDTSSGYRRIPDILTTKPPPKEHEFPSLDIHDLPFCPLKGPISPRPVPYSRVCRPSTTQKPPKPNESFTQTKWFRISLLVAEACFFVFPLLFAIYMKARQWVLRCKNADRPEPTVQYIP